MAGTAMASTTTQPMAGTAMAGTAIQPMKWYNHNNNPYQAWVEN